MKLSEEIVTDKEINKALKNVGFKGCSDSEGRLMLLELICKAGAGYRNSHAEENYMQRFNLLKADRSPNKKGRRFICELVYASSYKKANIYYLIERWRL